MSILRDEFEQFLNQLLNSCAFSDYGPNGLQIEGPNHIHKVAFAVSATRYSIEQAIKQKVQALVVHHGLFWKFHGARPLIGPFARRVLPLVRAEINLFAYHLPLDAHLEVGNAAGIAKALQLGDIKPFGDYQGMPTGLKGNFAKPILPQKLKENLEVLLDHPVLMACPDSSVPLDSLGIITGGANSEWSLAAKEGLSAYLTGEMSEHDWHESQEAGVTMLAGGHNATEQFGVLQLQELVNKTFPQVESVFIASENPA